MMIGSAAVANVRRIQRYLQARSQEEMKQKTAQCPKDRAPDTLALSYLRVVRELFAYWLSPKLVFQPVWGF